MFTHNRRGKPRRWPVAVLMVVGILPVWGCGPSYEELRIAGQRSVADQKWGAARHLFEEAYRKIPEDAENLHDMGVCSAMLARSQFRIENPAAGMREADRAINFYSRSTNAFPGFQPSIIGKNRAQELMGQFEAALRTAHWAAKYVGPSAQQQIFLAREYEERGDYDAALLRLQQGIAMEPDNPVGYKALAEFHERHKDPDAAAAAYRRAYNLDRNQKDVAEILRSRGELPP